MGKDLVLKVLGLSPAKKTKAHRLELSVMRELDRETQLKAQLKEELLQELQKPVKSAQQLTNGADSSARETALRMILGQKGFSVHDWAKKAGVDFHTANNYLKGKTQPYPSTRKRLADALGVKVVDLPT
jgi:lambda repressor-like predicted transcriptional regulator